MSRKNIVKLIIFTAVMIVVGYFYAYVERDVKIYDTSYSASSYVTQGALSDGKTLTYTFDCKEDNLTKLKMLLGGTGTGSLTYSLADSSGKEIAHGTKNIQNISEKKASVFDIDTVKHSEHQKYSFQLTVKGSGQVAVYTTPDNEHSAIFSYSHVIWSLETMIVFMICILFLVAFALTLVKIFRK